MAKYDKCPNCGHKPSGHWLDGNWMKIYECKKCGMQYCHECNNSKCPKCGSDSKKVVGECWAE